MNSTNESFETPTDCLWNKDLKSSPAISPFSMALAKALANCSSAWFSYKPAFHWITSAEAPRIEGNTLSSEYSRSAAS